MKDKLIGLFILLMGLMAAGIGGSELKESLATKTPAALAWPQFLAQKPTSGWFKISGVQLDVTSGLWVENIVTHKMTNVYVPARAIGSEMADESPIEMLVKIEDPKIIATVKELKALDKASDEANMEYILSHAPQLLIERSIVGTIAEGFDAVDSDEESTIRSAEVALADDFVILQENAKPDVGGRVFMVLAGIGLSLLGLFFLFFKKPATPATPPVSPPADSMAPSNLPPLQP